MDRGEPSSDACPVCEGLDELVSRLKKQGVSLFEIQEHFYIRAETLAREVHFSRAARVREARLLRGVSQCDLAKRCGVTAAHLCKIENACERSSADLVRTIAKVLGVNELWLLYGEGEKLVANFNCSALNRPAPRKNSGKLTENAVKILHCLDDMGQLTRGEISRATGLSVGKVSSILSSLSVKDLVRNVSWGVWKLSKEGRARVTDG
jgi:transcriptional regulator with XRE-family HTH domain